MRVTIDKILGTILVALMAVITLDVLWGVFTRYALGNQASWSEELARYFFLWGALFGAAAACRFGQHGGIPLLVDRFPPKLQRAVEVLVIVGMLSFLGYLTWQSWEATARAFASGQTSLTTKIPIWVVNAGMFAAFALSILRTIQGFLRGAYRIDQPVVE